MRDRSLDDGKWQPVCSYLAAGICARVQWSAVVRSQLLCSSYELFRNCLATCSGKGPGRSREVAVVGQRYCHRSCDRHLVCVRHRSFVYVCVWHAFAVCHSCRRSRAKHDPTLMSINVDIRCGCSARSTHNIAPSCLYKEFMLLLELG